MAKSPEEGMASLIRNLEEETGRSIADWTALAKGSGLAKHGQIMAMLKAEHGLKHAHANQIALRAVATEAPADDPLAVLYAGAKAGLRPIHDALTAAIGGFGGDVEFAPKKANVSVRRSKQFALIQPSTATRVDLGLILKGVPPSGRFEASGSFNAMFTHRVRLSAVADVDGELIDALRRAYDAA